MSASVSSAGAYGEPDPVQTAIPRRVHASRSMCGVPRPVWQIRRSVGEQCEERLVDRRALADQDDRLGVADLRRALVASSGALRVDDDVVTGQEREAVEPLDRALVVLHDDDAHRPEPSSALADARRLRRAPKGRDPAWMLRFRLTLSRPAVSSFTPRGECGDVEQEERWPSPRKSSWS